ncbi:MAG TPA: heme o synthase [Candidatus Paceibacterota bacterium]|nr:heme o synthase [Candidatus Paceibacterota bacterium]
MWKAYYQLTKPGIVYGNLLTTVAAYLYASHWRLMSGPAWTNFLATIVGLGSVIASACVLNNFYDRDIDQKMERTKIRALAAGTISSERAIVFGALLGLIGLALLVVFVNLLTAIVAAVGFLVYVFAYTFAKRKTEWATEIGSIAGAMPIVAGYTATTDHVGWTALILFLILALWQMPHFYSIAMFHSSDYATAGLPVLPLKKGMRETKLRMLGYIVAFAFAVFVLTFSGRAGFVFLVITEVAALVWFWRGTQGFRTDDIEAWARKLFFLSLIVLVVFSVALALSPFLP